MDSTDHIRQAYEKRRNEKIEQREDIDLAHGIPQSPKLVGHDVTLGFGYDLTTQRSNPLEILADLAAAGIALTMLQKIAIIFYGVDQNAGVVSARAYALNYLDDLAAFGTTVISEDRAFVGTLGAADRTDEGLLARLLALKLTITKPQGEALLNIIVEEKGKELDDFLKKRDLPDAELKRFHEDSDQRAVLVDMYYQSWHLFGPALVHALKTHEDAAAALEIAFLSNKDPHTTRGDDERNFERARTFLGGMLAPRNEAEARAFLRAIAARAGDLAQALAKRRSDARLDQRYLNRLNEVAQASLDRLGIAIKLTLQPDGSWLVGSDVPLERLAEAFGLSPLALALVNPELFPTAPDSATKFPAGKLLHLPNAREREALVRSGVAVTGTAPAAPLTPEAYDALRKEYQKNLAHPPRRGHASLQGDELLGQFSPASLEIAENLGRHFSPALDPAVATRLFPELEALPILAPAGDLRELGAAVGFGSTSGLEFLAPRKEDYLTADGFAPLLRYAPAWRGFDRAELQRTEAAIARCIAQAERLDREVDRWIERRNAARRYRSFY